MAAAGRPPVALVLLEQPGGPELGVLDAGDGSASHLLDDADNTVDTLYAALPERLYVLDETGTWRLEVLGTSLPGGEYRLRAKAAAPGKVKDVLTVGLDDAAVDALISTGVLAEGP